MRVLFLIPHSTEGPSSRYRVLQYVPFLEAEGIHCTVSSFLSGEFYRIAYQRGQWFKKCGFFLLSSLQRLKDLICSGRYDVIFIHLEAFPIGPPVVEWILSLRGLPIVFDLDDAIFLPRPGPGNPLVKLLRMPRKIESLLRWSQCVLTCNDYLRQYAQRFNSQTYMIPTCVDVRKFNVPSHRPQRARPLIGWIGSHSTAPYLEVIRPVLGRLARECPFTFKIVGSMHPFQIPGVEVIQESWTLDKEVSCFQELDIGVYPLPKDSWVLGKTGFKTVQYMSVGVPCVVSDIGRNQEIVQDGVNGFLAESENDWFEKIRLLLENPLLRMRLGAAGRKTVEERFAMHIYVSRYIDILYKVAGKQKETLMRSHASKDAGIHPTSFAGRIDTT